MKVPAPPVLIATSLLLLAGCRHVVGPSAPPADRYRDPDALQVLLSGQGERYFLIDVRTPEEYSSGHIPTAINIPAGEIASKVPTTDRSALIIVYCRSGARSVSAKSTLDSIGYTRVADFGSITRWKGSLIEGDASGERP